jgi:predicted Fe-S protein YdhL (DUF1289 family)
VTTHSPRTAGDQDKIRSPCVGICELQGRYCRGCRRTLDEIAGWVTYSPAQRDAIITDLDRRTADSTPEDGSEETTQTSR